ncbi:MAG: GNAT family N-acetyltransferase [Paracoccaceae bacterium]|nr:MAG: GNAT family N-acetyltransferase [Paracoccaceae bacterium]
MTLSLTVRTARPADLAAVDLLLSRSYPRLLADDYPPSVLVTALPLISRAQPGLLASGRYFVVMAGDRVAGAGGYSLAPPQGRGEPGVGHIRHVATDPGLVRQGVGAALMAQIFAQAAAEGVQRFDCLSTRTAVPFYAAQGFRVAGEVEVRLAPGIGFPAVRMVR